MVAVASWNEWGEGHVVEPTEEHGYGYLEAIGETFNGIDQSVLLPAEPASAEPMALADESDCTPLYGAFGYFNFSGQCSQPFGEVLIPDDNWHVFEAKIQNPRWRGRIWSVRIDLPDGAVPGIQVEIDYVKFKGSR